MIVLEYILLVGVIVCAIAAPLCKRLLASVIVYMALSLMMAVLWSLLQSPCLLYTSHPVEHIIEPEQLQQRLERMEAAQWNK